MGSTDPPRPVALPWQDEPCAELTEVSTLFGADLDRWTTQDAQSPPPTGHIVAVGSSSIRRWETAFRELAPWGVVQRGFGGALLREVAGFTDRLILPHAPSAVLLFAGTNDVAGGLPTDDIVRSWRCVAQQLHDVMPGTPLLYVGITPTPQRWATWPQADAVNQEVRRLSDLNPDLHYIDVPTPFLATGSPPANSLFVDDGLHLSEEGYALWTSTIVDALHPVVPERHPPAPAPPPPGAWVRIDLGPSNPEDGLPAPEVDAFDIRWNTWHPAHGGEQVLAGEALRGLRTTADLITGVDLVITGGFRSNGLRNGGLTAPDGALLGTLAVPEATADFFYTDGPDDPAGLALTGLDPAARYTLRLFASRAWADETRVTRYTIHGGGAPVSATLRTSGADIGHDGWDGNDDTVLVHSGLQPDPWGQLHVDVRLEQGTFAYLSLLELEAER